MQGLRLFFKRYTNIKKIILVLIICPIVYFSMSATLPLLSVALSGIAGLSTSVALFDTNIPFLNKVQSNNTYDPEEESSSETINSPEYVMQDKPTDAQSVTQQDPPSTVSTQNIPKPENAGTVKPVFYSVEESNIYLPVANNTFLKNCTTVSRDSILGTLKQKPTFKISANKSPEVLIMHTHATEAYQPLCLDWFDRSYNSRTTDNTKNTVRVGDEIQKQLELAGIGVIHNATQHDYPSYTGAYERSCATVKDILSKNPSIKVVLDVHRDAIQPNNNTLIAPTAQINGKSAAQVMIISGCDNGKMNMPKYMENLKLSSLLQSQMGADYPGLSRPILFDYRKYNQDLTTGSILLEMGGHGNSLEQAIYSGELVGKALAKSLLTLK
ncbi:MAG: stage II sporulation protein P [Oscillospiraceae bacterium]